jgi:hypothetical protein
MFDILGREGELIGVNGLSANVYRKFFFESHTFTGFNKLPEARKLEFISSSAPLGPRLWQQLLIHLYILPYLPREGTGDEDIQTKHACAPENTN